jgi:hypothetical protein
MTPRFRAALRPRLGNGIRPKRGAFLVLEVKQEALSTARVNAAAVTIETGGPAFGDLSFGSG